jgi:hypothetical protein
MNRTIAKIGYAPITVRAATGYTYGNIKWFDEDGGAGRNVSSTPFGETDSIFGNGRMIYGGEINNGRDLEVTLIDILDDIREDWLGEVQMSDGYMEKTRSTELPHFALLVAKEKFDSNKLYELDTYYDCQISERRSFTDKTSENNFDPEFPVYKIKSRPTLDNGFVVSQQDLDELPTTLTTPTIPAAPATP